jgi:hypothetical protein
MLRTRRTVAVVCIVAILFAVSLPGFSATIGAAVLVPLWTVDPDVPVERVRITACHSDEQTASLQAIRASRAPPAPFVPA